MFIFWFIKNLNGVFSAKAVSKRISNIINSKLDTLSYVIAPFVSRIRLKLMKFDMDNLTSL